MTREEKLEMALRDAATTRHEILLGHAVVAASRSYNYHSGTFKLCSAKSCASYREALATPAEAAPLPGINTLGTDSTAPWGSTSSTEPSAPETSADMPPTGREPKGCPTPEVAEANRRLLAEQKKARKLMAENTPPKDAYAYKYWQGFCDAMAFCIAETCGQKEK